MNNKKSLFAKILFPVALAAIVLSLTACGSNNSTVGSQTQDNNMGSQTTNSTASANSTATSSLQAGTEVPYTFFDDTVFVGDSVSLKLNLFVSVQREKDSSFMGTAQFLTPGSYGSGNELKELGVGESVHPTLAGTEMYLADAVKEINAKKMFIMLGMNDIAVYGNDGAAKNLEKVLAGVKEKNPDLTIYVQSMTPIVGTAQKGSLTNANLDEYNTAVKELCEKNGYIFLDVASVMKDDEGNLKREYCSDPDNMGVHFTDEGCKVWINYLRTHVS